MNVTWTIVFSGQTPAKLIAANTLTRSLLSGLKFWVNMEILGRKNQTLNVNILPGRKIVGTNATAHIMQANQARSAFISAIALYNTIRCYSL